MCGMVGLIDARGGDRLQRSVDVMLARLGHRGPDDRGSWVDGDVALGQVRLSILDPTERGHQPFVTGDGRGVIAFSGEVYNYRELRSELRAAGCEFRSNTDTEVVLAALHVWGVTSAVPRFNGMFAFAYFDARDRSLWLARDRLGIKPLFFSQRDSGVVFASEQKALLAHTRCDPDAHALDALLLYERFDGSETPYRQIENFPPGRMLRLQSGRMEWHVYFDVLDGLDRDTLCAGSAFSDHAERFTTLLEQSVERHLISDVPLATMCSGGIDSGLVTALAARRLDRLTSYVADVEGMGGEERRRAALVANAVGAELRPVCVDRRAFLEALPRAIQANDQPLFFAQDVAMMLVAERIRADGFKVVLTGDGADELFGGYPWYVEAMRHWSRLERRARWLPDNAVTRRIGARVPSLRPVRLQREIDRYALTGEPIEYVASSFNTAVVGGMNRTLRRRAIFRALGVLPLAERAFLARNFEDVYVHLRECLNSLDRMTMHHSVEARVPFLDNHLIELGLALPVADRYRRGVRKRVVDHVARRHLPAAVIGLPKIGFTMPSAMWHGLERMLPGGRLADRLEWPTGEQHEITALLARRPYYLFRLLACEIWLRVCVDGEAPEAVGEELKRTAA